MENDKENNKETSMKIIKEYNKKEQRIRIIKKVEG